MPDSFYGGKPGFSFIIVANYASIDDMIENFQLGPSYEAVHFDEHVLINTESKNNPDNGKIYRRGYDYTNDMGGAVYVGTIVGPAGKAPLLELTTVANVKSMQEEAVEAGEGYDYRYSEGSYAPTEDLIPGYIPANEDDEESEDSYNDEIQWACCSIRDSLEEDCIAYIGFIFPYLVTEYDAESVSPYYNRIETDTGDYVNQDLIKRTDEGDHPYYQKWHFSIPKGIKGDSLNNFRVITASDSDGVEEYSDQSDDRNDGREILVYDYYNYDADESGDPVSIYLGDYNMIKNISLSDEGTITISYTHDDDTVYTQWFQRIDEVTLDEDGTFTVTYNRIDENGDNETYVTSLQWVTDIGIDEDGNLTIHYSNEDDTSGTYLGQIRQISSISINTTSEDSDEEGTGNQKVHVVYNTDSEGEDIGEPLNYIMKMALVEDDYHLLVYYSDPARRNDLIESGESYTYDGKDGWFDLGAVKDDSGILIGLNLTTDDSEDYDLNNTTEAIAYLNDTYSGGLTGTDLQGKVVTIGSATDSKQFYAFDYNLDDNGEYYGWYYLGSFNVEIFDFVIIGAETDDDIESKKSSLDIGGLWFVVED